MTELDLAALEVLPHPERVARTLTPAKLDAFEPELRGVVSGDAWG